MADEELEAAPKGGGKKMIMIAVGAIVLLVGGGAGGYFIGSANAGDPVSEGEPEVTSAPEGQEAAVPSDESVVVSLGSFTVNLRESAGARLLQMEIAVEASSDLEPLVEERKAQIRDAILMLASDYSTLELEGMDGKLRMRDELQRRINAVLSPGHVSRVYFTAFVVQ